MFLEHKKRGRTPFQPRVIEKRKKKLKKQSTFLRNICKTSSAATQRTDVLSEGFHDLLLNGR